MAYMYLYVCVQVHTSGECMTLPSCHMSAPCTRNRSGPEASALFRTTLYIYIYVCKEVYIPHIISYRQSNRSIYYTNNSPQSVLVRTNGVQNSLYVCAITTRGDKHTATHILNYYSLYENTILYHK